MSATFKVNIQDYIELYKGGMRLDEIKPLKNQTYRLFKESKIDIRIVHRNQIYKKADAFEKIKAFSKTTDYFYMIPITTIKGTIVGFIIRAVTNHSYNTIYKSFESYEKQVPLMFGFDKSFENFEKKYYIKNRCYPIIVCEGSKDCLMLKKIYPYVVANNTSSMGLNAYILRNISDSFLLAYDNDKAGQEGMMRDKKVLRNMGAYVDSIELHSGFKDCADYLDYPDKFEELKAQVKRKLKKLYEIER